MKIWGLYNCAQALRDETLYNSTHSESFEEYYISPPHAFRTALAQISQHACCTLTDSPPRRVQVFCSKGIGTAVGFAASAPELGSGGRVASFLRDWAS